MPQDSHRKKKPRDCSLCSIQQAADFWGPLFLQIGFITIAGPTPRLGVQLCVRVGGVVSAARLLQLLALPTDFRAWGRSFTDWPLREHSPYCAGHGDGDFCRAAVRGGEQRGGLACGL